MFTKILKQKRVELTTACKTLDHNCYVHLILSSNTAVPIYKKKKRKKATEKKKRKRNTAVGIWLALKVKNVIKACQHCIVLLFNK